jgi:ribosome-associated protein
MYKINQEVDSEILCKAIVEGMQEIKAQDITIIDLRNVTNAVSDFFVICSGESTTQVDGIANSVVRHTRQELQERPWHQEGKTASEWILVDYVSVVAHIFYRDIRSFFDLEDLWADGLRTDVPNFN